MKVIISAISIILSILSSSVAYSLLSDFQGKFIYKTLFGILFMIAPVFSILQVIYSYKKQESKKN